MAQWQYDYLVDQIHRTAYKKHESYVINSLLHDKSLSDLQPCTQFYVNRTDGGYALLDLYYPQIELAIEVDEPPHRKNSKSDEKRQRIVEEELKCEFIRIDIIEGNVPKQIEDLKNHISVKVAEYKQNGKFQQWNKPRRLDISEAKKELNGTLFLKIRGVIHPDELLKRQTGYWVIDKNKQERINQVIVVHDSVVSKVFRNINWHIWDDFPNKVGFTGTEDKSNKLVGTIIEKWNWQNTRTYSEDLY